MSGTLIERQAVATDEVVEARLALPNINTFCLRKDWKEHRSTDSYGALYVAARYIRRGPFVSHKIMWQHGCIPPWQQVAPEPLVYAAPKEWKILVAREDEKTYLQLHGYKNVESIGLPFVYTPPQKRIRQRNSLLIMPVHLLGSEKGNGFEDYAEDIAALKEEFTTVVACINRDDLLNGFWAPEFTKRGIAIVSGAASNDRNALTRMRVLFESFETVTTNGWGSHCAYALYCGAKLSIWGTEYPDTKQRLMMDGTWAANPIAIDRFLSAETESIKEKYLGGFRVDPRKGLADRALGAWLVGGANKRSARELQAALGWNVAQRIPLIARQVMSRSKRKAHSYLCQLDSFFDKIKKTGI